MDRLKGVFPVVQTPFDRQQRLDTESLEREVDFCKRAGAHGLVYPVLASEFQHLTLAERRLGLETVLQAAAGEIPVVAGVADTSAAGAEEHARHAAQHGATAVIALPPYIGSPSVDEAAAYYAVIAAAADGLPVFIQDAPPGLPVPSIMQLLRDIENVRYVKEENEPSAHNISRLLDELGDECWGVFGGAWCRWMMSELDRGAHGFMPSVEIVDGHVQVWNLYHAGRTEEARAIYNRLLPFINLGFCLGLGLIKEALVKRGILATAATRRPGLPSLDACDRRELDIVLADLEDVLLPTG